MKTIKKLEDTNIWNITYKINELIDAHNAQVTEEVWPKEDDTYWFINSLGQVIEFTAGYDEGCEARRGFLGIYRTEYEALEAKEKIIKAVKWI